MIKVIRIAGESFDFETKKETPLWPASFQNFARR